MHTASLRYIMTIPSTKDSAAKHAGWASHKWALDVGSIDSLCLTECRLTKVGIADCSLHNQIDIALNDGTKIVMQRAEVFKRIRPSGKEVDEEVDVAVGAKVSGDDGSKQC